ncbi:MAG: family 20 glycosylhydrolase [Polyangiaceae bacterium]
MKRAALGLAIVAAAACGPGAGSPRRDALVDAGARATPWDPPVVPRVARVDAGPAGSGATTRLGRDVSCDPRAPEAATRAVTERLCRALLTQLRGAGTAPPGATATAITLELVDDKSLGEEGYSLEIDAGRVVARAAAPAGLFYATQTLSQLAPDVPLPVARVFDAPAYRYRGVHLDVARHFFPRPVVERLIDLAARHKLNVLHLHLTDDQGWRMPVAKWPRLTDVGGEAGRYTREDIAHMVAFAEERFVTIVPEIDMPGHMSAALSAYPELRCASPSAPPPRVRTTWGVFDDVLCPDARGVAFARDVIDALVDAFPGPFVHIGGDEVPLAPWRASPRVADELRRTGLADERALMGKMLRELGAHVAAKGRRAIGWDESLDVDPHPSAAVMAWRGLDAATRAARAGRDVILAPYDRTYFNFYEGDPTLEPKADGQIITLTDAYALDPAALPLTAAQARHVMGVEACAWTEYIETEADLDRQLFPRLLATAEAGWTPHARRDDASFTARTAAHLPRLDALGVGYRVPSVEGLGERHVIDAPDVDVRLDALLGAPSIRVTLDGTDPTVHAARYAGPVRVPLGATPVIVTARSFTSGGRASPPRRTTLSRATFAPAARPDRELAPGVRVAYFEGRFESARALLASPPRPATSTAVADVIALPAGARAEHFGALYTGFLCVPRDAVWAMTLTSDDGAVLSVGGEVLVDLDGRHAARAATARVALREGCHALSLAYFQGEGERALDLTIASEEGAPRVVGVGAPARSAAPPVRVGGPFLRHAPAAP